jgi:hypothetical protein
MSGLQTSAFAALISAAQLLLFAFCALGLAHLLKLAHGSDSVLLGQVDIRP